MAPSRRRKVIRDSKVTQAFFNQGNSDNDNSGVCSCCLGRIHSHATNSSDPTVSSDPGDINLSKLAEECEGEDPLKCSVIETRTGTGGLMLEMSTIWRDKFNKLTPKERLRLCAAIKKDPAILEPTRALQLAHEQMSDETITADQLKSRDCFDLDNLEEVAETYDKVCQMYKDGEEEEMANLAGLVGELAVTASDENRSSDDRLVAELNMQVLNIYSKITVPLNSCLRQVQHFNVEKRFGCEEENYRVLQNDDAKQWGDDVPAELPPSYLQRLNDPFTLTGPTSKSSKKTQKKKLSGVKALVELQRNCKLAIEEMQGLKKTISHAEKPIEPPSMPASFTYRSVPVPEGIPDHIRQRFFDGDFAHQEVLVLRKEAQEQLLSVRSALSAWSTTSHEVWYVQFDLILGPEI